MSYYYVWRPEAFYKELSGPYKHDFAKVIAARTAKEHPGEKVFVLKVEGLMRVGDPVYTQLGAKRQPNIHVRYMRTPNEHPDVQAGG